MTAAAAASCAAAGSTVITVTVGNASPIFGFQSGSSGAASPSVLYGSNILLLDCTTGPLTTFRVNGVVGQNFFTNVTFTFGASGATTLNLTSAAASYSTPGASSSQWTWANATFSLTDATLARFVIFYR